MTECSVPIIGMDAFVKSLGERPLENRLAGTGTIEVTPYCNLKCAHCYVTHCHWEGRILSRAELCPILDEIAEEGCLWLLLTGGEPFLRDDFLDIYTYAKKKGIFVSIFTNGTLVTPDIARYLHDWPPQSVEMSLYGATRETYESITGVAGSFERCLRGIELLLEQGIKLTLKTVLMTLNRHELDGMKKLAQGFGVPFRYDPILNPGLDGSRHPCGLRMPPEEVVRLDMDDPERREAWTRVYRGLPKLAPLGDAVFRCGAGMAQFHIDAFGGLQPCTIARQHSYDLRRGSFRDGWRHFLLNVGLQKQGQPSPCRKCQYREACFVCAGWAQLESGTSVEQPVEYLCQIVHLQARAFGVESNPADNAFATNESALNRPLG